MFRETTYNGNDLFGINFNLYPYEDINPTETLDNILEGFKFEYYKEIKTVLATYGLDLIKLDKFSPKEYNYLGDSIDPTIQIVDIELYKKAITANSEAINAELAKNKSYDGYMALTKDTVNEELETIKNDLDRFSPDTLILSYLLTAKIDFNNFDIFDYFDWDIEEDN